MKSITAIIIMAVIVLSFSCGIRFSRNARNMKVTRILPGDFQHRTFALGLSAYRNKINKLPGRIIKVTPIDTVSNVFRIKVLDPIFLESGSVPEIEFLTEGELVNVKINNSFNSSFAKMVLNIEMNTDEVYELSLADIAISTISDTDKVDRKRLFEYFRTYIDPNELDQYFFVNGSKLTLFGTQKFRKLNGKTAVNGGYLVGLEGGVYHSSSEKVKDYFVTVDMVELTEYIPHDSIDIMFQVPFRSSNSGGRHGPTHTPMSDLIRVVSESR